MKPIVLTIDAINAISALEFDIDILDRDDTHLPLPLRRVSESSGLYIFSSNPDTSRCLIIRRWEGGLFKAVPRSERRQVFNRCARIALESFDQGVTLNPKWMPFHSGNRISVFARGIGHNERVVAEVNAKGTTHTYVYEYGQGQTILDLENCAPNYSQFDSAVTYLPTAISDLPTENLVTQPGSIELDELDPSSIAKGFAYDLWLPRLAKKQREFFDHKLTGPIRLRGAAGTGKTLALIMKALKERYDAAKRKERRRILFVTHSWAMAEQVDAIINQIDTGSDADPIVVYPLLSVIPQKNYEKIGRRPLGLDSDEGKRKSLEEITSVLDEFRRSDWLAYRSGASQNLRDRIEAEPDTTDAKALIWDLLTEFGCVLAAQGILTHEGDKARYFRIKRMQWMMPLDGGGDKDVVFSLWKRFLNHLKFHGLITSDQIIADALNELSTFYWEAARVTQGYDIIFVDEMHLFNAQERLIFHHLLANAEQAPLVVMALDPKQSPRQVFTSLTDEREQPSNIYDKAKLPNSERIDLDEVYRYTPEIVKLIRAVLDAVPGLDVPDDWDVPLGNSALQSGPVPLAMLVETREEMFKVVISQARKLSKEMANKKGRTAILCLDDERFSTYARAAEGQFPNEIVVIASRDDTEKLRYAHRKIVLSTPEYVAGLQFDSVILADVNRELVPEGKYNGNQLRKFLAELYLGISRAERRIIIIAAKDAGGVSPYIESQISDGTVVRA
jgi:superfamily I DNA/RNA helicase